MLGFNVPVRGDKAGQGEDFRVDGSRADRPKTLSEPPDQPGG